MTEDRHGGSNLTRTKGISRPCLREDTPLSLRAKREKKGPFWKEKDQLASERKNPEKRKKKVYLRKALPLFSIWRKDISPRRASKGLAKIREPSRLNDRK